MTFPRSFPLSMLALAACSAPPLAQLSIDAAVPPLCAEEFPGASKLLQGYGPRTSAAVFQQGDAVLFGLRLCRGGTAQRWLLSVVVEEPEARERVDGAAAGTPVALGEPLQPVIWPIKVNGKTESFHSALCRVAVTVADADGRVLACTHPLLPRDFLQHGFAPALRQVQRVRREWPGLTDSQAFYDHLDAHELAEAVVCAVALVQVVQDDAVLAPILWQVVQKPPIWSVVTNFGVDIVIQPRFHAAVRAEAPPGVGHRGPVWSVPMRLLVNYSLALTADLLVGSSDEPLTTCGGILGAIARHPTDADVEFSMLLLAAQRGERIGTR